MDPRENSRIYQASAGGPGDWSGRLGFQWDL